MNWGKDWMVKSLFTTFLMMLVMTVTAPAADKDSKDKTVKRLDNYIAVFDLETKDVDKKYLALLQTA